MADSCRRMEVFTPLEHHPKIGDSFKRLGTLNKCSNDMFNVFNFQFVFVLRDVKLKET